MTDTRTFDVQGATLTITLLLMPHTIDLTMTVDTSALDANEPDHSQHNLISYLHPLLPSWEFPKTYWWCRRRRTLMVKTGAQAQRVIRHAVAVVGDAVAAAVLDRQRRKAEIGQAFAV
jgi:hypothetical protein